MKKTIGITVLVLVLLALGGYFFFPKSYPAFVVPKLEPKEHQARCAQHKSDQDCSADMYCQGVEMTPVCIPSAEGQVCLPGGYSCVPDSKYTKAYPDNVICEDLKTEDQCKHTANCGWIAEQQACVRYNPPTEY